MKKVKVSLTLLLIASIAVLNLNAQTPNWTWAKSVGNNAQDYGVGVATDANNNIIATGLFKSSTISFGNITLNNTAAGFYDIYVVKYDSVGNVLWAANAGSQDDDYVNDIAVDNFGNIYITGRYGSGGITFGNTTLSNNIMADFYLAKITPNGSFDWALTTTISSDFETGKTVCVDNNNDVIVSGIFNGSSIAFGSTTHNNNGSFSADIFINKYTNAGILVWSTSIGGNLYDEFNDMVCDPNNNFYATGYSNSNSVTMSSSTLNLQGGTDAIVIKFNSNGVDLWGKSVGGNGNSEGTGIDLTSNGDVYVSGFFNDNNIPFGNTTLGNANTNNTYDAMLLLFNSTGNENTGKRFGGLSDDFGVSVNLTSSATAMFGMNYYSSTVSGFTTSTPTNAGGGQDALIANIDNSNTDLWVKGIKGSLNDWLGGFTKDNSDNVIVTGGYNSFDLAFHNDTLSSIIGGEDAFIAKLNYQLSVSVIENLNNISTLLIYPNPTNDIIHISGLTDENCVINLYDINGKIINTSIQIEYENETRLDISSLTAGTYIIEILINKYPQRLKLIKH